MTTHDETAKQALSVAGAMCGDCGDEPGDRKCPDCQRFLGQYVNALRKAGWAPRTEVMNEAAEVAVRAARSQGESETGQYAASVAAGIGKELRRLADAAVPEAKGSQPQIGTEYGIRVPNRELPIANTISRAEAEDTLQHLSPHEPDVSLVQRIVAYGPWTDSS